MTFYCAVPSWACCAACSIRAATSLGRDSYTEWLAPLTSTTWLWARAAYIHSRSGLMTSSASATSAQLGFLPARQTRARRPRRGGERHGRCGEVSFKVIIHLSLGYASDRYRYKPCRRWHRYAPRNDYSRLSLPDSATCLRCEARNAMPRTRRVGTASCSRTRATRGLS
jgi:hypothetical protein